MSTVYRYLEQDMSLSAIVFRNELKRHGALTEAQENIVAGWVVSQDCNRLPTSTSSLKCFVLKAFETFVSKQWISAFRRKYHFSYKVPSNMHPSESKIGTRNEVSV